MRQDSNQRVAHRGTLMAPPVFGAFRTRNGTQRSMVFAAESARSRGLAQRSGVPRPESDGVRLVILVTVLRSLVAGAGRLPPWSPGLTHRRTVAAKREPSCPGGKGSRRGSDHDALDLVQRDFVIGAVVELGGARGFVRSDSLGVFEGAAVKKERGDARGAKGVAANVRG